MVPAAGTAQVLVPPVISSASGSGCAGDLDYALTPSTVEVAQVSEQPVLLPSDVGSASGSTVQADDIVVPAVRKTKCVHQQTTRLAQADSIGGRSQKRFVILGVYYLQAQTLTQFLVGERLCDTTLHFMLRRCLRVFCC